MGKKEDFRDQIKSMRSIIIVFSISLILLVLLGTVIIMNPDLLSNGPEEVEIAGPEVNMDLEGDDWNKIENGIHVRTGLKDAEGLMAVVNNCTICHSAELV